MHNVNVLQRFASVLYDRMLQYGFPDLMTTLLRRKVYFLWFYPITLLPVIPTGTPSTHVDKERQREGHTCQQL